VLLACLLLFPAIALITAKNLPPRSTAGTTVRFEPTDYAARDVQCSCATRARRMPSSPPGSRSSGPYRWRAESFDALA
ncbi:MAG: hypothetical protein O9325_03045, partial [Roseomonas sp.]|nr:hypothetical protein [Roseomonas sp.]